MRKIWRSFMRSTKIVSVEFSEFQTVKKADVDNLITLIGVIYLVPKSIVFVLFSTYCGWVLFGVVLFSVSVSFVLRHLGLVSTEGIQFYYFQKFLVFHSE